MIVFSGVALYLTSLWNKGFLVKGQWDQFLEATLLIAGVYYIVIPIGKALFIPLNLITLGFASVVLYFVIFYFALSHVGFISIHSWQFPGIAFSGISIQRAFIGYRTNIVLASLSISSIINLLENIL